MKSVYLDNSATTPLCEGAKRAVAEAIERFGNPSSLHFEGLASAALIEKTRKALYKALGAREEQTELIFTSGGTEANDLAIFGTAYAKNRKAPKILVTDSEHPCILEPCKRLEAQGFSVVRLRTKGGRIDEAQFFEQLDERVFLISLMSVNNETGAVYDVPRLFDAAKKRFPEVVCHTDAVQAFFKIPFSLKNTRADLVTLSSHKIHGPKGCGALVVSREILKRKALLPQIVGGGQQNGLRSGTQNTIGIAGFGGAIEEIGASFEKDAAALGALRTDLIGRLPPEITVNAPPVCAPHILSITLPNIKSETALHFLSARGICVSNGSACSSGSGHKSGVLTAFGLSEKEADATLRVSFSRENTKEDNAALAEALTDALGSLVRFK